MQTAKQSAKKIIDHLPEKATWDDIMYELYVKQKIEIGLEAAGKEQIIAHEEVKRRLLNDHH